jgi:4-hydroxy-tetrahydrodipicolinate synthase
MKNMAISRKEAREKFRGLFTPLMTPFKENYDLDLDGLRNNIRYLLRAGFGENNSGSFLVAGAGGEFPTLTMDERKSVAQTVVEETRGKVPLIFGAQHTNPQRVIELCKFAKQVGMDGVQLSTPYYDPGQTVDDIIRFFKQINDATDIGIMVYTDHWHGHRFPREFFTRILDLDHVVAVKFGMPSVVEFRDTLVRFSDKLAFVDNMTEHVTGNKLGEVGFLSHEAHFHLEHQLQLWNSFTKKDYTKAVGLLAQLNWPFNDFRYDMANPTSIGDANSTKAAIEMIGLAAGPVRPPARNLTSEERARMREILVKAGAPVKEATGVIGSRR